MKESGKATLYIEKDLHKALKVKAAETEKSVSELVNDAIRLSLTEDAEDLEAFRQRQTEKSFPFEEAVKRLKARGGNWKLSRR